MLAKGTILTAKNINDAFISKNDTSSQTIQSPLVVNGGQLTLKNSVITDNSSTGYMRIDPQGNTVIVYDGVNNQQLSVYSSSGSEATYISTINGTPSYGIIDVTGAPSQLNFMWNSQKPSYFGGNINISNSRDLVLQATTNDPGDLIFKAGDGTEYGRVYSSAPNSLFFSTGTNPDPQIAVNGADTSISGALSSTGKITANAGIGIKGGNPLQFDDYGGGFYMADTTWIRSTNSKSLYTGAGIIRSDAALQVGTSGDTFRADSGSMAYNINALYVNPTTKKTGLNTNNPLSRLHIVTDKNADSGIRIDTVRIDTVGTDGNIAVRGLSQLRFSDNVLWDYNTWAGIKYEEANKRLVIGGPASTLFSSNASPPQIKTIFDGVSGVGINTLAPRTMLEVNGDISLPEGKNIWIGNNGDTGNRLRLYNASGSSYMDFGSGNMFIRKTDTTNLITLTQSSRVGINTTNPAEALDVQGNLVVSGVVYSPASNSKAFQVGDDVGLWDVNVGNTLGVYGVQNTAEGGIKLGSTGPTLFGSNNTLKIDGDYNGTIDIRDMTYIRTNGLFIIDDESPEPFITCGGGDTNIKAAGGELSLGGSGTILISILSDIHSKDGTKILDTAGGRLYYQGQDMDVRYEKPAGAQTKADNARNDSTKAFKVEVRTSDPVSPAVGQMWLRSDL